MKATLLLILLISALVFSDASAVLYVYDPYNVGGADGYVAGQSLSSATNSSKPAAAGSWTGPVAGSTSYLVSETGLSFPELATSGGSLHTFSWATNYRPFSETNIQTPVYYSFLINFSTFNNSMIMGLADAGGANVSGIRVYEDGSLHTRSTGGIESAGSYQLALDTTYLIVGRVSYSAELTFTDIWIDPTPGAGEPGSPTLSGVGTPANGAAQWYSFLADGGSGTPEFAFDEFRAGSTWESVTPVPEPSSLAFVLAGLGAMACYRRLRRSMSAN